MKVVLNTAKPQKLKTAENRKIAHWKTAKNHNIDFGQEP